MSMETATIGVAGGVDNSGECRIFSCKNFILSTESTLVGGAADNDPARRASPSRSRKACRFLQRRLEIA
jgi:hypothetical protein